LALLQTAWVGAETAWTWRDAEGVTHARTELDALLTNHSEWLKRPKDPNSLFIDQVGQANFYRTDLRGVDLMHQRLDFALFVKSNLSAGRLSAATLENADFADADLTGAYLNWADLQGADFSGANLRDSHLVGAVFDRSPLFRCRSHGSNVRPRN
jgi:uncharacterized protein YjbI with pentapeptide repeats